MLTERLLRRIAEPLQEHGFQRQGRRRTWHRSTPELSHLIAFEKRGSSLLTQWGVIAPQLIPDLWEVAPADAANDVAYSFMSGWAQSVPGTESRTSPNLDSDSELDVLRGDLHAVADWLAQFDSRRDARGYLLSNREQTDRRAFIIPAKLPLKLVTCALLADVDADEAATTLATEALHALESFPAAGITEHRRQRLRSIVGKGTSTSKRGRQ